MLKLKKEDTIEELYYELHSYLSKIDRDLLSNKRRSISSSYNHTRFCSGTPIMEASLEMIIQTERLMLRDYIMEDFDALYEIMSNPETMQHYPKPFDAEGTKGWIEWNLQNYKEYGFGL